MPMAKLGRVVWRHAIILLLRRIQQTRWQTRNLGRSLHMQLLQHKLRKLTSTFKLKRWQAVSAVVLSLLILLLAVTPALGDDFERIPPLLATVISKSGVFVDGLLGHWVSGNDLTSPAGEGLIEAVGQLAVNTVHFFAVLVTLF